MIVTLSPDNSSQPFIRPSVYLLPITDINFIVCYCNSSDRNAVYVSSSVLSHCSIKHDGDDDDDDDNEILIAYRSLFHFRLKPTFSINPSHLKQNYFTYRTAFMIMGPDRTGPITLMSLLLVSDYIYFLFIPCGRLT